MKKNIFIFIPFIFLFFACGNSTIFYDISQEIKLAEPNIQGDVQSVVRLGNTLYTQNGNIYSKSLGEENLRKWSQILKPSGKRIVKLATNGTDLYAQAAWQTDDEGKEHSYQLYVSSDAGATWAEVSGANGETSRDDVRGYALFDNAGIAPATEAYVRIDEAVYTLSGATKTLVSEGTNGSSKSSLAVARLTGGDFFADTTAFCSDDVGTLYRVYDEKIQTLTDTTNYYTYPKWVDSSVKVDDDATVMIYKEDATNPTLLVGTTTGIEEVILDSSSIPTSKRNLSSNAEQTIGKDIITTLAYFGQDDDHSIYVGAIDRYSTKAFAHALWAYSDTKGTWNYE